ncbi:heme exporter protein CcmD [Hydrogenophaga sp.]|uniref:heme exporter protein CcmD n=1 Tax=Hydrogenophaga sp. TaxID=1904254 RepID=UPI00272F2CD8|nr:heme exporter protein CcmD [Hydrogenophaga sp.]MDP2072734.1 heme exporter protein CcmD [Hydrogenophaga sp.]MDP3110417.1 heme exporter protein CcmD [Hydrogenophaga sp.]MDP3348737.1 heme exporter protein CcmD [Hydrogenophaga sp.]MDZ4281411.1 heme exporter protein CcmD [Hydrogenophaga sp.]
MNSLGELVAMGGYGLYVWGSLGMCAAVVVAELMVIRFRRRLLAQEVEDERAPGETAA